MKMKQYKKWQKIRNYGKKKFILKYGVLFWGLTTALIWSLVLQFLQHQETWYIRLIVALVLFPIGGIFFGIFLWNNNKKDYNSTELE